MGFDRKSTSRDPKFVLEIVRSLATGTSQFSQLALLISIRSPVWIVVLWNANGAAIFQPAYFYFVARSKARLRDPAIPLNDAMAIFVAVLPIMACPLLLFTPAWLNYSTWDHHGFIALFHTTPILVLGLFLITTTALLAKYGSMLGNDTKNPNADKPWIVASLIVAGTVAAGVHIYTVLGSLKSTDPDATLIRLFVPSHGRANPFPTWITTVNSTTKGLSAEYSALLENFHLFSQYDWIVVCLSCILFVHLLLSKRDGEDLNASSSMTAMEWRDLAYLTWSTILLGPGAAGSFALAVRESRIREGIEPPKSQ